MNIKRQKNITNHITGLEHNNRILNYFEHCTGDTVYIGDLDVSTHPDNPYYSDLKSYFLYLPQVYDEKPTSMDKTFSERYVRSSERVPYTGQPKRVSLVPYMRKTVRTVTGQDGKFKQEVVIEPAVADNVLVPHFVDPYVGNNYGASVYQGTYNPGLFKKNNNNMVAPPLSKAAAESLRTGKSVIDIANTIVVTHDRTTKQFFRKHPDYGKTLFEYVLMTFGEDDVSYIDESTGNLETIHVDAEHNLRLVPIIMDANYNHLPVYRSQEDRMAHFKKSLRVHQSFINAYAHVANMKQLEQLKREKEKEKEVKTPAIPKDLEAEFAEFLAQKKQKENKVVIDTEILDDIYQKDDRIDKKKDVKKVNKKRKVGGKAKKTK